jgi:hypothetical protein
VRVVDTIGAGDHFASGFLYAHLLGLGLRECCAAGCAAGSAACTVSGATLPADVWEQLRSRVSDIVGLAASGGAAGGFQKRAGVVPADEAGALCMAS